MSPWLQLVIGVAILGGLVVAGRWLMDRPRHSGLDDPTLAIEHARAEMEKARAQIEADRRARTVVVSAEQLLQEFQDAPAADRKYRGKYLEMTGIIERVGTDGDDNRFVILHAGDEQAALKIECFFDTVDEDDATRVGRLSKGTTITVRGEYRGRVSNIQVRDCVLVK
jgi:hypothetical protein